MGISTITDLFKNHEEDYSRYSCLPPEGVASNDFFIPRYLKPIRITKLVEEATRAPINLNVGF